MQGAQAVSNRETLETSTDWLEVGRLLTRMVTEAGPEARRDCVEHIVDLMVQDGVGVSVPEIIGAEVQAALARRVSD